MTAPLRLDSAILTALRAGHLGAAEAARLADVLRIRPGERSWATRASIVTQHELIIEVALRFYAGSKNHRAKCIHRDLGRYQATTWQHHRANLECLHIDPRQRLFWYILKARDRVPGMSYLNRILRDLPAR